MPAGFYDLLSLSGAFGGGFTIGSIDASLNDPIVIQPNIYFERFMYRGASALPGSKTISSNWTNSPTGAFTTSDGIVLRCRTVGELIYSGTSLRDLKHVDLSSSSNYSITFLTIGRANAIFEIRGRRLDSDNYISFKLDFSTQTISLNQNDSGVLTILESTSYDLISDKLKLYAISLRFLDDNIFGYINGYRAIESMSNNLLTTHGFSLYVPEIDSSDPVGFSELSVAEVVEAVDEQLEIDNSDLMVRFRKQIRDEIKNPTSLDWSTFKKIRSLWEFDKDVKLPDKVWANKGYPIEEPTTERFFE